jgi:glucuronoarabinoxylan endo-1,4-beta-xylanase
MQQKTLVALKTIARLALLSFSLTAQAQSVSPAASVNWTDVRQTIDGFGGSVVGAPTKMPSAIAQLAFSTTSGIGLSIARTEIIDSVADCQAANPSISGDCASSSGATSLIGEAESLQEAQSYGVTQFFATSWSPPGSMKSNGSYTSGGNFIGNATNYTNFAATLASYVPFLKNNYGITLKYISPQNEPDISVTYPSALWTAAEFDAFVPYLYSDLSGTGVGIMLPENSGWSSTYDGFTATIMTDSTNAPKVGILAQHGYGGSTVAVSNYGYGQHVWVTEDSNQVVTNDGMSDALNWAQIIHNYLTVANVNAYVWWAIWNQGRCNNSCLTTSTGALADRAWITGNWSRYVRPGWVRIDATANPATGIYVSAFKDPNSTNFSVVVINTNSSAQSLTVNFSGVSPSSVMPVITDADNSLTPQSVISVSGGSFTTVLMASSVTTFVNVNSVAPQPPTDLTAVGH